ncbi:glutamate decarboxylase [Shewanella putrefaciens]|nr:glutamate decarboxylase [Shewanella putrefaciens]
MLANPLTSHEILNQVLVEQSEIAALDKEFLPALMAMVAE